MNTYFYYAELNAQNVCTGIKSVTGELNFPSHVLISDYDISYLNKKYENGEWSKEQFLPDAGAIQLSRMDQLEKSQADQDELLMQLMLTNGGN
ncbi:hypothetical protein [Lysinibacillus xylanilyticus]|uniref:hypothetical protein n=1 Tax=Lysinibacillus xylanilyticus TaxID=582475 RepID=UPI003D03E4E5